MNLTKAEVAAIQSGATEIRRPVMSRLGADGVMRDLKCRIKRGTVATVDELTCVSVRSVKREGREWVFGLEVLGSWAKVATGTRKEGKGAIETNLPGVLKFDAKPDLIPGDIIEFEAYRERIRDPFPDFFDKAGEVSKGGPAINEDVPGLYLEVTSVGRDKKGKWAVRYRKHGFDDDEYLAPKLGYTKNPAKAISKAPIARLRPSPEAEERNEAMREIKRLESQKEHARRKLMKANGPGGLAASYKAMADAQRKIRVIEAQLEASRH